MRSSDCSSYVCSSDHLRDEHTRVLVRRLVRDYVLEHKGRILLALLGMAIVAASTADFTQLIKPVVNEIFIAKESALLYPIQLATIRSATRHAGKTCVSTSRSRWSSYTLPKKI